MDLTTFIHERRPQWRKLEDLLTHVEGSGLATLTDAQAVAFAQLYRRTASDLNQVIALRPDLVEAYKHRAIARQELKQYAGATADLSRALALGAAPTHVYFLRAAVRERAGDSAGAAQDRAEGLRRTPTDRQCSASSTFCAGICSRSGAYPAALGSKRPATPNSNFTVRSRHIC